ncbi:MAG: hypothetical protein AAGA58_03205 [Verrucomicrobiota bacterium]
MSVTLDKAREIVSSLSEEEKGILMEELVRHSCKEPELSDSEQAKVEQTLLSRAEGPFVPLDEEFWKRVRAKCDSRMAGIEDEPNA